MVNVVVTIKFAGESRPQVRQAARIKLDGQGNLILTDATTGAAETIWIADTESIGIQIVEPAKREAA